jgi:hypothetical protein
MFGHAIRKDKNETDNHQCEPKEAFVLDALQYFTSFPVSIKHLHQDSVGHLSPAQHTTLFT